MIELSPGNSICVTLFDANHCSGAVMFLIEGQGKAILYTGDVRSEKWWVDHLVRHSKFVLYASGLRKLDKIYLDTTFASNIDRRQHFQSKAEGLRELLDKVDAYPEDTVFYFNAWTFGYEDVWLALSQFLNSQVHLDRYRYGIYTSVSKNNGAALECPEAPVLCGFRCGNTDQPGILTRDTAVRLHSCERNTGCPIWDPENATKVVTITPIISRQGNIEVREAGAGGGHGDLNQIHELDLTDMIAVQQLFALCLMKITDKNILQKIVIMLQAEIDAKRKGIQLEAEDEDSKLDLENIPIDELPDMLAEMAKNGPRTKKEEDEIEIKPAPLPPSETTTSKRPLPRQITFPYSRHSSHSELRLLLAAFRPRDVWPNTFSKPPYFTESMSMETLFGDLCDKPIGQQMAFDIEMRAAVAEFQRLKRKRGLSDAQRREMQQSQTDDSDDEEEELEPTSQERVGRAHAYIPPSLPQPARAEDPLDAHKLKGEDRRVTVENMQLEKQTSKQHRPDPSKHSSPQQSVAIPSKSLQAPPTQNPHVPPSAASPTSLLTTTTFSTTAVQLTSQSTSTPIIQHEANTRQPNITSSTQETTSSRPAKLNSLDDRINAAMLADNITRPQPPPLCSHPPSKKSRLPPTQPNSTTKTPHSPTISAITSSPSSLERFAARQAAFEAARSGEWGVKIKLASVPPLVKEVGSAGLKGQEEVNDMHGDVRAEEEVQAHEMGEDEDGENSSEYGMIEAGRWGE